MAPAVRLAIALIVLIPLAGSARATPEVRVDAGLAWGGIARPNTWTELRVRVASPEDDGTLQVEARVGPVVARLSEPLQRGQAQEFRLPIRLDPGAVGQDLSLVVRLPGGSEQSSTLPLRWIGGAQRAIAVAARLGGAASAIDRSAWLILPQSADAIPSSTEAFSALDALVVDTPALSKLSDPQLAAVEQYLGGCGRVVLVDPPAAARQRAHSWAGCGAKLIREVAGASQLQAVLTELLAIDPPRLPDSRALTALFPEPAAAAFQPPLIGFFILYVMAISLCGLLGERVWLLVSLPLAGSLVLAGTFLASSPVTKRYTYVEATSGSRVARYAELTRIGGAAPYDYPVVGRPALGTPARTSSANPTHYQVAAASAVQAELRTTTSVRTRLLSETILRSSGALAWSPPLQISSHESGRQPRVTNRGDTTTVPATLLWHGAAYRVPALSPGASFEVSDQEPLQASQLPRWLAERRAFEEGPMVVLSGYPPALAERAELGGSPSEGWIVLRSKGLP
jgi:hypothetical protein